MARLSFRQILLAIAIGAIFATLQGEAPVQALNKLAVATCTVDHSSHC